uniref:Uncharacterized protein n=1 Tax=Magnetococcus massalia (strain MO-1) TaxID=451514 RepID=A0A1S7LIS4_MAGMO|nr:Protein of unknown function [Candidatus Magnetococcus massalia]
MSCTERLAYDLKKAARDPEGRKKYDEARAKTYKKSAEAAKKGAERAAKREAEKKWLAEDKRKNPEKYKKKKSVVPCYQKAAGYANFNKLHGGSIYQGTYGNRAGAQKGVKTFERVMAEQREVLKRCKGDAPMKNAMSNTQTIYDFYKSASKDKWGRGDRRLHNIIHNRYK